MRVDRAFQEGGDFGVGYFARFFAIMRPNVTVRPQALPVERFGYVME